MKPNPELTSRIVKIRNIAFLTGLTGSALCGLAYWLEPRQFDAAYLTSFLYWLGLVLGAFPLIFLHHLTGGQWGFPVRRLLEAVVLLIPVFLLFFLPILFRLPEIYSWADPETVRHDHLLMEKAAYLNPSFFTVRLLIYFLIWTVLAVLLTLWSHPEAGRRRNFAGRLQVIGGLGLVLYGLTSTYSSIDWAMSLEPHWYSSIYGLMFMASQTLTGFAFVLIFSLSLVRYEPFSKIVTSTRAHDLGNLFFAFILIWAYLGLSQFIIIWSGNLAEEVPWYLKRFHGVWLWIALLLVFFHFVIPFFLLLMRRTKRHFSSLLGIAALILVMRWIDLLWMVKPAFNKELPFHWADIASMAALGGLWISFFCLRVTNQTLTLPGEGKTHGS